MTNQKKSINGVDLATITITDEQMREYSIIIRDLLSKLYPESVEISGIYFIKTQEFENPVRKRSILNYLNTNITFLKWLCRNFEINSYEDIIYVLSKNSKELFLPGGEWFENTIDILKNTERIGELNEFKACDILKNVINEKLNEQIEVKKTQTDSEEDILFGIDIFFKLEGKIYTYQVKPLKGYNLEGKNYIIKSSGRLKYYENVHYIIFINNNKYENVTEYILFKNRIIDISGTFITIGSENMVSSGFLEG